MAMDTGSMIHILSKVVFLLSFLILVIFWPSISLIILISLHLAICCTALIIEQISPTKKDKHPEIVQNVTHRQQNDSTAKTTARPVEEGGWDNLFMRLVFQFEDSHMVVVNLLYIAIFLANFNYFFSYQSSITPPLSLYNANTTYLTKRDHSIFAYPEKTEMSFNDDDEWRTIQLAQQGYYTAERYTGKIGKADKSCGDAEFKIGGWRCYSIGVRLQDNIYQPLPTPAYKVDILLGFDDADSPASKICDDIDAIFFQHVNPSASQSVLDTFSPVISDAMQYTVNSDKQICPFGGSSTAGLGCSASIFPWNYSSYQADWKKACTRKYGQDNGVGYMEKMKNGEVEWSGVFVPVEDAEKTITTTSGFISHTIVIMHSKNNFNGQEDAAPILRVSLKGQGPGDTPQNFIGVFHPLNFPAYYSLFTGTGSVKKGQSYDTHLPIYTAVQNKKTKLQNTWIPIEYLKIDFKAWYNAVIALFMLVIVISVYYAITDMQIFHTSPYIVVALGLRIPASAIGFFMGFQVYAAACILQVFAYLHRYSKNSKSKAKVTTAWGSAHEFMYTSFGYVFLLACAFALYLTHAIVWLPLVVKRDELVFSLYNNWYAVHKGPFVLGVANCKLLSNFFVYYVVLDSITNMLILFRIVVLWLMNFRSYKN
jgi:hypothetical protein